MEKTGYDTWVASSESAKRSLMKFLEAVEDTRKRQKEFINKIKKLGATKVAVMGSDTEAIYGASFSGKPPADWVLLPGIKSPVTFYVPRNDSELGKEIRLCSMPLPSKYIDGLPRSFCLTENRKVKSVRVSGNTIRVPKEMGITSLPGFILESEYGYTQKDGFSAPTASYARYSKTRTQ